MTRDTVLASRGNASRLTTEDLDLPSTDCNLQPPHTETTRAVTFREGAPKHIQLQVVLGKRRNNLPTQNGFFYDDSSEVD